ncbi:zinc-binding dehydrogenase [Streptococcus suis]
MKAVVVSKAGGPEVLEVKEVAKPQVKTGWSLVNIKGFGINHSEIFTRQGLSPSVVFPRILGIELVGVIEETTEPDRLPVGQKVISIMGELGRAFDGGYAEYALVPNQILYPVQTDLGWAELASVPETYYTAYGSMKNLKLEATDRILVRAGASGVGQAFVKLVRSQFPDLPIYASVRKLEKTDKLLDSGFSQVILEKEGRLQTGLTFTKIFELVGPATLSDSLAHLEEGGIICSTGQLGGKWYLENFDPIEQLRQNVYLTTFYSGNVNQDKLQEMFDYLAHYQVPVGPEKIFSLDTIQEAHRYLEGAEAFGKVIVLYREEDNDRIETAE